MFTFIYKTKTTFDVTEEEYNSSGADEEEQKTVTTQEEDEADSSTVKGKREFRIWKKYQTITQQMPSINNITDNSYFKTKEYKEKLDSYEVGSLREQMKPSPFDYTDDKKVPFGTLSV